MTLTIIFQSIFVIFSSTCSVMFSVSLAFIVCVIFGFFCFAILDAISFNHLCHFWHFWHLFLFVFKWLNFFTFLCIQAIFNCIIQSGAKLILDRQILIRPLGNLSFSCIKLVLRNHQLYFLKVQKNFPRVPIYYRCCMFLEPISFWLKYVCY